MRDHLTGRIKHGRRNYYQRSKSEGRRENDKGYRLEARNGEGKKASFCWHVDRNLQFWSQATRHFQCAKIVRLPHIYVSPPFVPS